MGTFQITSYCQEVLESAVSSSSLFPRWVRTSNNESANLDDDIENIQNVRIGDRSDASFIHRTLSRRSGYKTIPFELGMPFMTLTWQQNIIHSVVEHKMNWFSNNTSTAMRTSLMEWPKLRDVGTTDRWVSSPQSVACSAFTSRSYIYYPRCTSL